MSTDWISKQILCNGELISPSLDWNSPLHVEREEVAYKIRLIMKSFEMVSCEGRQLSLEHIDLFEEYHERLADHSLDEESIRLVIRDFGNDFSFLLQNDPVVIDPRALTWTKRK